MTNTNSYSKRNVAASRREIQVRSWPAKPFPANHAMSLATLHRSAILGNLNTSVLFLVASLIMLISGQALGHDDPGSSATGFRNISSVEGFHDAGYLSFTINFINAQPIDNGFEFQLFFDTDFSTSTGYGQGYEALLRGVQLVPQSPLDFARTINGSSSGGWGQLVSSAYFDQINSYDFYVSIPRNLILPLTGSVKFGIEIYQWGVLVDSASGLFTSQVPFVDCNGNGISDGLDIADGLSLDCNNNNSPDSCDLSSGIAKDCNGNSVPDSCDIASFVSEDCTNNRIPDECEPDCNNNNQADSCDIATWISSDCDLNEMPDECQPLAKARGPRYLEIHPPAGLTPVAVRVRGSQSNPAVSCLDGYVQLDASIGPTPFFQIPSLWCTVFVTDYAIVPDREYTVDLVNVNGVQESVTAKTWLWGDLNHDLVLTIGDVIYSISSTQGVIVDGFPAADLVPCEPDGEISISDIIASINALVGIYTHIQLCGLPCI